MRFSIITTILLIISNLSFAQESNTHLTLTDIDTLFQTSIEELIEDSVKISIVGQSQWIKVDSIIEIRQVKKSKFWQGAGIGLLGGAVLGGVLGRASYEEPDAQLPLWLKQGEQCNDATLVSTASSVYYDNNGVLIEKTVKVCYNE